MAEPFRMPAGVTVESVDWLPSGARSGLIRVRGRGAPAELPALVLGDQRFGSLPDPRADREPGAWRGAYVVDAAQAAAASRWALEWPDGHVMRLDPPAIEAASVAPEAPEPEPAGGEVVDRAVLAERRARRAEAAEAAQARIAREALRAVEVLELRSSEIEDRLAALQAERDALLTRPEPEPEPVAPASDPARLRDALAATIAVVADLRLQLHEAQLARRSREVAWSADAVKLTVLAREHEGLKDALRAAQAELAAAEGALAEARAAAAGAEAAHDQTRRRFTERVAELAAARERIAELEAQAEAVKAEAARVAAAGADARVAAVETDAAARVADAETAAVAALERAARAEDAVADALLARELAEAAAAAARAQRHVAEVRRAAQAPPEPAAPTPLPIPSSRTAPPVFDLANALGDAAGRLREQADRAAAAEPEAKPEVAAGVDAAAADLRRRATIVSAPTEPPGDLVRGQGARAYPPLRGALVKLAHDDPAAAARLVAGLLPAARAGTFDVTLEGAGTFAVADDGATAVDRPRGRPHAAFHLRMDGVTAAELLAGVGPKPGRRSAARASGRVRRARAVVRELAGRDSGLSDLLAAGAAPDPLLALRALAYAVHPSQTAGRRWCVAVTGPDGTTLYACADDGGLQVRPEHPEDRVDARLRLGSVAEALGEDDLDADGDLAAVAALRGLARASVD